MTTNPSYPPFRTNLTRTLKNSNLFEYKKLLETELIKIATATHKLWLHGLHGIQIENVK